MGAGVLRAVRTGATMAAVAPRAGATTTATATTPRQTLPISVSIETDELQQGEAATPSTYNDEGQMPYQSAPDPHAPDSVYFAMDDD